MLLVKVIMVNFAGAVITAVVPSKKSKKDKKASYKCNTRRRGRDEEITKLMEQFTTLASTCPRQPTPDSDHLDCEQVEVTVTTEIVHDINPLCHASSMKKRQSSSSRGGRSSSSSRCSPGKQSELLKGYAPLRKQRYSRRVLTCIRERTENGS